MKLKTPSFIISVLNSTSLLDLLLLPISRSARLQQERMSIFAQKLNPVTGKAEWEMQREDYDFQQEVARSAYADMLHDRERNQLYYRALHEAIKKMHLSGKKAYVLDIGTGSGLLSMMAAECGADTVTACEAFAPMAHCAQKVININKFGDRIHLIPKRSTDITVGPDGDMKSLANILVTEVFDTELIGEGAIATFTHAHQVLLEKGCIVIPSAATVYAQVVESELAVKWNRLFPIAIPGKDDIKTPPAIGACPGAAAVHDIQLSQMPYDQFTPLTKPVSVLRFDWSGKTLIPYKHTAVKPLHIVCSGATHAVFMWWELRMDTEGKFMLSCAPYWAHPNPDNMQWRDHWMQAVYYLPQEIQVQLGDEINLVTCHDEYSLWFSVENNNSSRCGSRHGVGTRPVCECAAHVAFSRTRLGMMNDKSRNEKYVAALQKYITPDSVCLCLSDGSLLSLVAARLGAKMVYAVEINQMTRRILNTYIRHNKLDHNVVILDKNIEAVKIEDLVGKVSVVLGEPYFLTSLLPWHGLCFWYWKNTLSHLLTNSAAVLPCGATVWAVGVEFKDLWKIRAPLHSVEGFKMEIFDQLIENACAVSDSSVEPQPLWEYPCRALTQPVQILAFNFTKLPDENLMENNGRAFFEGSGNCNGVVLWVDWILDDNPDNIISTGPTAPPEMDKHISWDMHTRQGVHLFQTPTDIGRPGQRQCLKYSVQFIPTSGDLKFSFSIEQHNS